MKKGSALPPLKETAALCIQFQHSKLLSTFVAEIPSLKIEV